MVTDLVKIEKCKLEGTVRPPTSKSVSHRALILSSFSSGSQITGLLESHDTLATKSCLETLGVEFTEHNSTLQVLNPLPSKLDGEFQLDCKNSGTSLRLLMGICAGFDVPITLFGDDSLNSRPIAQLAEALKNLGVSISTPSETPPITLKGPVDTQKTYIEITGKMSSQFISSLLILGSRHPNTFSVKILPPVVSQPYISLTSEMLSDIGINIEAVDNTLITQPSTFKSHHFRVPVDFSSAAFFLAAGALPGNSISVEGYFGNYTQADRRILSILAQIGAHMEKHTTQDHSTYKVVGEELFGDRINLIESPDLFPILSILATQAEGETEMYGAHHLKFKETNRIEKMTEAIKLLGGDITPTDDGAIIKKTRLKGGVSVDCYGDHRIAMALTIAGSVCEQPIEIRNADSVNVSYPTFFDDFNRLRKQ